MNSSKGFDITELEGLEIDLKDNNYGQIETIKPFITGNITKNNSGQVLELNIYEYNFTSSPEDFFNNKIIIRIPSIEQADTLSDISYTRTFDKIPCNKCFLSDGRSDVVKISGMHYKLNKTNWKQEDGPCVITRKK